MEIAEAVVRQRSTCGNAIHASILAGGHAEVCAGWTAGLWWIPLAEVANRMAAGSGNARSFDCAAASLREQPLRSKTTILGGVMTHSFTEDANEWGTRLW